LSSSSGLNVTDCDDFWAEDQSKELHLEPQPSRPQEQSF